MTKIKNSTSEVRIVKTTVGHNIKIFECQYRWKIKHGKMEIVSSLKQFYMD